MYTTKLTAHNTAQQRLTIFSVLLLLVFSAACQTQPTPSSTAKADTHADETALRTADEQWSKAAEAKDVDKTVAFYAPDATVLPPNAEATSSKQAIHDMWKSMLGPSGSISWKVVKVEVAKSGDLGYVTGTYNLTENDASGKPVPDKGKYVEVWKKQADGSWKCIVDMFSSNLPPVGPAATSQKAK